ncbi:MAG: DegT/DnrJ/EryC1/StrS family aminotransferase [Gammaproteobacteria bacterium]|nr:DegT/DnrJ/EryC1/StrS family aminotransferase [Gammaproteobacteria bacterium]
MGEYCVSNPGNATIPLVDLGAQYRAIKADIDAAVIAVLDSGQFTLGPAVADFEASFCRTYGMRHAVACSSGTAALHMALKALDIGPGDEVITTAMTFIATASAVDLAGAKPVLVDIKPDCATLDPDQVASAISPRTRAIVPVHLYGQCADMAPILAIARKHGLSVIEDAAQAHGAMYQGQPVGTMGDISCFSFYPGKNLGAYGEGGLVATQDDAIASRLRMLRDWGQDRKYHHAVKGFNYRMDGVQGAVLGVKMRFIEAWTERRRAVARWYSEALAGLPMIALPQELRERHHVWHIYGVRVPSPLRTSIAAHLSAHGIATGLHYPVPVHMQPCFADLGYSRGTFPVAERHAESELSLPMYPEMTQAHVGRIADCLRDALRIAA